MDLTRKKSYMQKRICGTSVVRACHIYAIINAVIVGISVAVSLVVWLMFIYWRFQTGFRHPGEILEIFLFFLPGPVAATIAGVFAMLLLLGTRKKKAGFVKAYLIYGIIVETGLVLGTISFVATAHRGASSMDPSYYVVISFVANGFCVLYGFVLWLVNNAHTELNSKTSSVVDAQMLCLSEIILPQRYLHRGMVPMTLAALPLDMLNLLREKKAGFVKAYLIYGIIVETGLVLGTISFVATAHRGASSMDPSYYVVISFVANGFCVLYGFVLWLVNNAHTELNSKTSSVVDAQMLCLSEIILPQRLPSVNTRVHK